MQCLKQGEAAEGEQRTAAEDMLSTRRQRTSTSTSPQYGIRVEGVDDVMLRLAKCCRPVPATRSPGYISLGRGITIHREDSHHTRRRLTGLSARRRPSPVLGVQRGERPTRARSRYQRAIRLVWE